MAEDASIIARLGATELFGRCDRAALETVASYCSRIDLGAGDVLFRQGDRADALFVVVGGRLRIIVDEPPVGAVEIARVGAGTLIGEMHVLNGGRRTATVDADEATALLRVPYAPFHQMLEDSPVLRSELDAIIRRRFRKNALALVLRKMFGPDDGPALHALADRMRWREVKKGDCLFREGDAGGSLFFVVSGLLQVSKHRAGGRGTLLGEVKRGDCLGEMAMLTGNPRSATVRALRDSELAELPRPLFEQIAEHRPAILRTVVNTVINRLDAPASLRRTRRSMINIAVVPISPRVPVAECMRRFLAQLSAFGVAMHWNSARVEDLTGIRGIAQTPIGGLRHSQLCHWLDEQEVRHAFNIFETDRTVSPWTHRCLERADRVCLLAHSADDVVPGSIETELLSKGVGGAVERTLVLLHDSDERLPAGTRRWLAPRRVTIHHHLRMNREEDFRRLARFAAGRTIGLVLGGGGARGLAHIGVVRALSEAGIPVDVVGGTSIGAVMAAQPAMGWDYETMLSRNRTFFVRAKPLSDYTIPLTSLVGGKRLDESLQQGFRDIRIEDLWLNYFSLSSDLTAARPSVHRRGDLWKAVRASLSIPGIVPPVIDGERLLVDGGLVNNLPADVMKSLFGGFVIAVDVGRDTNLSVDYAAIPSPLKVLWSRVWPFTRRLEAPRAVDILIHSALLNSVDQRNVVKSTVADLYLQPPVSAFRMLDFSPIEALAEAGYRYTQERIEGRITRALRSWANA